MVHILTQGEWEKRKAGRGKAGNRARPWARSRARLAGEWVQGAEHGETEAGGSNLNAVATSVRFYAFPLPAFRFSQSGSSRACLHFRGITLFPGPARGNSLFAVGPFMSSDGVILLAEDTEDDILLIKRALFKGGVSNPVQVVRNGAEAISYLKGEAEFTDRDEYPLPEMMLLDLKMPIVDGFEVLRWVRRQPLLSALPVLVLTSSDSLRDVNLAYRLGANSFLVKPFEFEDCLQLGQAIREYWLGHNRPGEISRPPQDPPTERLIDPRRNSWTS